ncbi:MAG: sigma-70 family RNA polymerase sigma factor [Myxococcota bacterium]
MSAAPRIREHSDRELDEVSLVLARRGDRGGCTRFVAFYERLVFAAIGRILGPGTPRAQVEDLAQDAFLRALRALPRFDPGGPAKVSTWLLTIATRVALSDRGRKRIQIEPLERATDRAASPIEGAFDRAFDRPFDRWDARRQIEQAAAQLTPQQRAVFVLRDVHGLTETETAAALGVDVAAAKSRLFRARARLRRALSEVDDDRA